MESLESPRTNGMTGGMGDGDSDRLMGWKAIGSFVGRDVRTARRWEAERGMPVHRVPGSGGASVWADSAALRVWLAGDAQAPSVSLADAPPTRRPLTRWMLVAAMLAIAAAALIGWNVRADWAGHMPGQSAPFGTDKAANAAFQAASYAMNTRSVVGLTDAARQFDQLSRAHPGNAAALVGLAETNLLLREFNALPDEIAYRRAALAARQALAIEPRSPGGLRALAFVRYWSDGESAEAFDLFRRAIAVDPSVAQSWHWYGTALAGDGRFAEALAALDRARMLNPGSSAITADAAYVRYMSGDRRSAIESLKRVTAIDPTFSGARRYLAAINLVERDDAGFLAEGVIAARLTGDIAQARMMATASASYRAGGRAAMLAALIGWAERAVDHDGGARDFRRANERGRGTPRGRPALAGARRLAARARDQVAKRRSGVRPISGRPRLPTLFRPALTAPVRRHVRICPHPIRTRHAA